MGNDDKRISLGKKETGARAALPIWLEFMQQGTQGMPVEDFPNVVPLEKIAPDESRCKWIRRIRRRRPMLRSRG